MKRILSFLFLVFLALISISKAYAMNFEQAFNQVNSKPMVVLAYAQWAENYQNYIQQFRTVQAELGDKYNFVEMDIASKDTKAFNERYHIYPKLPYVLMYRDGGKVSRYIPRECASNASCMSTKLKSFIQW